MPIRWPLIISLFFIIVGCAKTPKEKLLEAIDIAQTYLSKDQCQEAIDVLEDIGRELNDADYVQVLASAYACRASFSELTFFDVDISKIDTSSTNFLNSLTKFTSSPETVADSSSYTDIRTAINILLYQEDTISPSQTARNNLFGTRKAGDVGAFALYLSIAQLGKFLHFYGNVDSAGAKGLGTASVDEQGATPSHCFVDYQAGNAANTYINLGTAPGGICDNTAVDTGHPNLSFAAGNLTTSKRRLCEGLMLFTNIIDIINNIDLSSNTSLGSLTSVVALVNQYKTAMILADPTLTTLLNTTSQSSCETAVAVQAEFDRLQYIYALFFETGL